jgi:hypothetical protein
MPLITTPLQLYKHLPRTNCGDCGIRSCLAFAAAVLKGEKRLDGCPHLDRSMAARLTETLSRQVNLEGIQEEQLRELQGKVRGTDIFSRAGRLGVSIGDGTVIVTCLGKDFEVDRQGNVRSQCHTHAWFSLPLLDYVLHSRGAEPTGRWVPFRELPAGRTWNPLFERRCEQPLKRIADAHSELFADLVTMFSGLPAGPSFDADISVILHPLPKVPLLICYWRPEDGMESRLHLFFDETAEWNLPVSSLFTMSTGIARMIGKIMHRHTGGGSDLV